MRILKFVLIIVVAGFMGLEAQPVGRSTFLQWSRETIVKSPNEQFEIEVHPILTDEENHSPVVVRSLFDKKVWNLFTLRRAAQTKWSPDSQRILIIDEPAADNYEVRLFSSRGTRTEVDTDEVIRLAVANAIGSGRTIEFYLPTFISWRGHDLVLAIGGTSSHGINKPMAPYCFAVRVNDSSGAVLATLSDRELKKQFNAQCRLSP